MLNLIFCSEPKKQGLLSFFIPYIYDIALKQETNYEIVLIDAIEIPIERQKYYYFGKRKRHTIKSLVVINKADKNSNLY